MASPAMFGLCVVFAVLLISQQVAAEENSIAEVADDTSGESLLYRIARSPYTYDKKSHKKMLGGDNTCSGCTNNGR